MHIGIDVGGTKIEIVLLDANDKQLYRNRVNTPAGDYTATIQTIVDLIHQVETNNGNSNTIGIGIPGTVSPDDQKVKNANSTWLMGMPFKHDIEEQLGRTINMANDANCFVLSEYFGGAAINSKSAFGVILGTGVGGGLIYQGRLVTGANGIGGEWGHNHLYWPPTQAENVLKCYCGLNDCIETYLSGPGFSARFTIASGRKFTPQKIIQLMRQGDQQAQAHFKIYCQQAAKALAQVINIFDPEVIVLGGGMSNIDELYSEIPKYWQQYVFSNKIKTQLLKAKQGDSSGVLGAACLYKSLG